MLRNFRRHLLKLLQLEVVWLLGLLLLELTLAILLTLSHLLNVFLVIVLGGVLLLGIGP